MSYQTQILSLIIRLELQPMVGRTLVNGTGIILPPQVAVETLILFVQQSIITSRFVWELPCPNTPFGDHNFTMLLERFKPT